MDTKTILTSATVTGLLLTALPTLASPEAIVIERQGSQVTEHLSKAAELSFTPIEGSIIPIAKNYTPFQLPEFYNSERRHWSDHLGQPVRVEHKSRDLSLEGTLEAVNDRYFTLSVKRVAGNYPISDFYLIPTLAASKSRTALNYQGLLTYQTSDILWQPELTMIIDEQDVTLVQQANIQNHSSQDVDLSSALLHYNQKQNVARPMLMKSTMASDMSLERSAPATEYSHSEITLELEQLALPAASQTLVDLGKTSSRISNRSNVSTVYSYPSSSKLPLSFQQQIRFDSPKDLIPGHYQTLWHKKPYYLKGNPVTLQDTREGAEVEVMLNRSLDLSGDITLITESHKQQSTTQTWELTLKNLSKQPQNYAITHRLEAPIRELSLRSLEQIDAQSVALQGTIAPNTTYQVRYTAELTHTK
ncbi:hypothetical protein MAQ5080_00471 [Marinomonas aquimarina]|uniref:DUF4139 domain-containing protein n=1 Tax=Marinomonas aquimarina TaxID=295068 RepID=A0A1A8T514_9GAMM|nr:hypothetical protein [Marinomonas aquimarina]SBS26266.1 hypothetical protein MAQ5080_00471 [Marinomonas aquimarina]